MGIEYFSPEEERIARKDNLEIKMLEQHAISRKDIEEYADYIVSKTEETEDDEASFVVDALSDSKILGMLSKEQWAGELSSKEAKDCISLIRRLLIEKLKDRLDKETYLVLQTLETKKRNEHNVIQEVVGVLSGQRSMHKEQHPIPDQEEHIAEAIDYFMEIIKRDGSHANIVNIEQYDPESKRTIYEKLDLRPLNEYLNVVKSKSNFITGLKVVKDCLNGAEYLADNGLVLQDIKLSNLGVVSDENVQKGVLFDLEGLVKNGRVLDNRLRVDDYLPPEFFKGEGIQPSEMTYQFGICLSKMLDLYEREDIFRIMYKSVLEKLDELAKKMIVREPKDRISLTEAKGELEEILANLS
ncbi:MAG TPA: hypothetical protein VLK22_02465 [Candidatus Udaeobacter sp.]|nr:hypothetical protein [Candidatus Udaeobacter sp.]